MHWTAAKRTVFGDTPASERREILDQLRSYWGRISPFLPKGGSKIVHDRVAIEELSPVRLVEAQLDLSPQRLQPGFHEPLAFLQKSQSFAHDLTHRQRSFSLLTQTGLCVYWICLPLQPGSDHRLRLSGGASCVTM